MNSHHTYTDLQDLYNQAHADHANAMRLASDFGVPLTKVEHEVYLSRIAMYLSMMTDKTRRLFFG